MSRDISKFKNALQPMADAMMDGPDKPAPTDLRLGQPQRKRWADTIAETRSAAVADRDESTLAGSMYDLAGGGTNKLMHAMATNRTMDKAVANFAKEMAGDLDDARDEVVRQRRERRLNEDGEEMSDDEADEKACERNKDLDLEDMRAKRLAKMKEKFKKDQEYKNKGHGEVQELSQDEVLPIMVVETGGSLRVVIMFYLPENELSKVMDKHMRLLAKKHMGTKFCKVNAEKVPFFVDKLNIRTIPSLVSFKDGKAVHKQLGCLGLGVDADGNANSSDEFPTWRLARVISEYGDAIEEIIETDDEYE